MKIKILLSIVALIALFSASGASALSVNLDPSGFGSIGITDGNGKSAVLDGNSNSVGVTSGNKSATFDGNSNTIKTKKVNSDGDVEESEINGNDSSITVTAPKKSVKINPTGVSANSNGKSASFSNNNGSLNIQSNNKSATINPTGVITNSNGKSASVSNDNGSLNIRSNNKSATINPTGVITNRSGDQSITLSSSLDEGAPEPETKTAIVNLDGNSIQLVKGDSDVKAYSQLVLSERPNVKSVTVDDSSVTVSYKQPAKFLGLFSTSINAEVVVDENSQVEVSTPWYGFLFSKKTDSIKKNVAADLKKSQDQGAITIKSIDSNSGNVELRSQNRVKLINIVTNRLSLGTSNAVISSDGSINVSN